MSVNSTDDNQVARRIQFEARARVLGASIAELEGSGFLAPGEPRDMVKSLQPFRVQRLVDLGCGNGHVGFRIASDLACSAYVGIDRVAVRRTKKCMSALPTKQFLQADFTGLGESLPEALDGAISHDALYLSARPAAALRKLAGLIGPTRPLLLTIYVGTGVFEAGIQGRSLGSWKALLKANGFSIESIADLTNEWRHWASGFHAERLRLCRRASTGGRAVRRLELVSRHFLGKHGGPSLLSRVERFRLLATVNSDPAAVTADPPY